MMHSLSLRPMIIAGLTLACWMATDWDRLVAGPGVEYNRDIRPILAENCFSCHGPDSASRKADLRLDQREAAVASNAFKPGKPGESEMITRVMLGLDDDGVMPPKTSHKSLTPAQKELLKRWIESGAEYQAHWSLIPPRRPVLPEVRNREWARTPIDRFILAALEKQGLTPAPEADRRTLVRRLSLDLTGLPPTPDLVESVVKDPSANWYEKLVDQLLKSPHWGEHRARYWLDAARYADTHGIHFDNYREIWSYRDWVIRAFNQNLAFDQFTIEQLAGDLLPNATLDQKVATGFNRCNITTNEGGAIDDEYYVLYARDRTETTAQVWMGLTAGCAVCHDHKFDPLSMKDFYSLSAFFNNSTQRAMDGNIKDTPPTLVVPIEKDRPRWETLSQEIASLKQQSEERKRVARGDFDRWLEKAQVREILAEVPTDKLQLHLNLNEGRGGKIAYQLRGETRSADTEKAAWVAGQVAAKGLKMADGVNVSIKEAGDFDTHQAFSTAGWIRIPRRNTTGAAWSRMDEKAGYRGWDLWIENDRIGSHLIHQWQNDALKVVGQTQLQPNRWYHVLLTYDGSGKAAGVKLYLNGVPEPTQILADQLKGTLRTEATFRLAQRTPGSRIKDLQLQDVRVYDRALSGMDAGRLARATRAAFLVGLQRDQRPAEEINELFAWWLPTNDTTYRQLTEKLTNLLQEEAAIKARGTVALVMNEKPEPPKAFVLFRGEYDKRRDPVLADVPKALPALAAELPKNRLGLAQWLLRPEHPLTARVTVNRFWQEVFGSGLVRTSGDFGITGELPSHPELLDWLAIEFREQDWDIKKFFKMLVMSATYRQSAEVTPEKAEKDGANRLLSRGARYRMDAEMIRDSALAASGLLARTLGGPSVKPYQPEGVWEAVAMIGSNTRNYKADRGENLYRRSLYTFWKRSAPPASMEIFNAPNRETCTVKRERTNTPLQALVTLNDPQFVEAARQLATRALLAQAKDDDDRIQFLVQRVLGRPFLPGEIAIARKSLAGLLDDFRTHEAEANRLIRVGESASDQTLPAPTLAAWTMLVNQLMNLDEFLCR